jgi:hypothetical protein
MHRPNEAAYSWPGLYVLDDWRYRPPYKPFAWKLFGS